MHLLDSLRTALRSLTVNKLRSALTMLGIVIGVAAVIALMSIGSGTQAMITSQFESMGTNLLIIQPGSTSQGGVRTAQGSSQNLTLEDEIAIADPTNAPAVAMAAPEVNTFGQIVAGNLNINARVTGTTPDYQALRNFNVAEGDFITQRDVDARSTVVVLGADAATNLFADQEPLGQSVKINRRQFRVVGVLERKGGMTGLQQDNAVIVPISTAQYRLFNQRPGSRGGLSVNTIYVQAVSKDSVTAAQDQVAALLRERHRITSGQDDFTITNMSDVLASLNQVMAVFTIFLGSIAGISLLVGSIGIMNIMLVSVTERTREIGIRKAIGAKRGDILGQFLIEAVVMSLSGGIIGVGIGWGLSNLVGRMSLPGMGGSGGFQTLVTPGIVILALSVSAAIGVFSGVYPAARAARLDPIVALRYE